MSIIKSTKSGRSGVELTLCHLLENGWYQPEIHDSFAHMVSVDRSKICPGPVISNNPHFLHISHDKNGVARMTLRLKILAKSANEWGIKPTYIYEFKVNTLADLDLVLDFWNECKINRKRALRDLIMRKSKQESNMWFSEPDVKTVGNYVQNDIDTLESIKQNIIEDTAIKK